jgi:hypothetical protein
LLIALNATQFADVILLDKIFESNFSKKKSNEYLVHDIKKQTWFGPIKSLFSFSTAKTEKNLLMSRILFFM